MTAASRPTLKALPPNPVIPQPSPPSRIAAQNVSRRWAIASAILLGFGGLSLIPIPESATGDAVITTPPDARQTITMPEAATVKAIYVRQNDRVRPGQLLAELSSPQLEQQLLELDRTLADAQAELAASQQKYQLALRQQDETQLQQRTQHQRVDRLQQELRQLETGIAPPQIRQLESQRTEKQSQLAGYIAQLAIVNAELNRYEGLLQQGAIALGQLDAPKRQQAQLTSQINATQAQMQTIEQQIAGVQKDLNDELQDQRQPELERAIAAVSTAQQETTTILAAVQKWQQQSTHLQTQKQQLLQRQEALKLRANVAGIVITPDLDLLNHQKLAEGKELVTIADPQKATASVELQQADGDRVKVGMPVTFRLRDSDLQGFAATVQEISPIVVSDPEQTQKAATLRVRFTFNHPNQNFSFGTKGYAHIHVGQTSLYQRSQQEFFKLFPVGRFI
jgi:multidrug resistance efflux pump